DEAFMTAYELQAFVHLAQGELEQARARAEHAAHLAPWDPVVIGAYAAALTLTGDRAAAAALLKKLDDPSAFGTPIGLAVYHMLCGNIDDAAHSIARAVEQRYPGILFFIHLIGRPLRESGHWPELARLMRLP